METDILIADTLLDVPEQFLLFGHRYSIYPDTLGKTLMYARLMQGVGLSAFDIGGMTAGDLLDFVRKNRQTVAQYVALHTLQTHREMENEARVKARTKTMAKASDTELAELLTACSLCSSSHSIDRLMKESGMEKNRERMRRVASVKDRKGSYDFGGVTIYGRLIDAASQRYGWTLDYVLWGISLANLQLMLADQVTNIYLTDDEQKRCHVSNERTSINGDDPRNNELIKKLLQDG